MGYVYDVSAEIPLPFYFCLRLCSASHKNRRSWSEMPVRRQKRLFLDCGGKGQEEHDVGRRSEHSLGPMIQAGASVYQTTSSKIPLLFWTQSMSLTQKESLERNPDWSSLGALLRRRHRHLLILSLRKYNQTKPSTKTSTHHMHEWPKDIRIGLMNQ